MLLTLRECHFSDDREILEIFMIARKPVNHLYKIFSPIISYFYLNVYLTVKPDS